MLLNALVAHGRTRTMGPAYYQTRPLHWIVSLSTDPALPAEVIDVRVSRKEKPRVATTPYKVRSGSKPDAFLLADNAEFVFAVPKTDPKTKLPSEDIREIAKAGERHQRYAALALQFAAAHPQLPEARVVERWLATPVTAPKDMRASDNVALQVDGQWIHELEEAKKYWAMTVSQSKTGASGLCLVCGTEGPLLATLPGSVKGVPGSAMNPQLISINQPAHFRNRAGQLSATPLCETCGTIAVDTLNALLAAPEHRWRGRDTATVWWTREEAPTHLYMAALNDPIPEHVAQLLSTVHNPHHGHDALSTIDVNAFYAATLGINNSRIVLRDWIDVPVPVIHSRIAAWLTDHRTWNGWQQTHDYFSIWRLTLAGARYDNRKNQYVEKTIPHALDEALLRTALHDTPPPAHLLPTLLQRLRADGRIDQPRCALLRLALTRTAPEDQGACMPRLNPEATDPGYVCGRIFAMLEAIQRKAMPKVNTTIGDRYRNTAMTSPGTILPMLWDGSNSHVRLIRRTNEAAAWAMADRVEKAFNLIDDEIPPLLSLREQARFVLGYAHQKQADLEAAKAAKAAKEAGQAPLDGEIHEAAIA